MGQDQVNQDEINNSDGQDIDPQLKRIQELEAQNAELEKQRQRSEINYRAMQSERDRLRDEHNNATAEQIAKVLREQNVLNSNQNQNLQNIDDWWQEKTDDILDKYNNGSITEAQKDKMLLQVNNTYQKTLVEKKAEEIASEKINKFQSEFAQQKTAETTESEFSRIWNENQLSAHLNREKTGERSEFLEALRNVATEYGLNIDPYTNGKFTGDPKSLKIAIDMVKSRLGQTGTTQEKKPTQQSFSGIHTSPGENFVPDNKSAGIQIESNMMSVVEKLYGKDVAKKLAANYSTGNPKMLYKRG